MQTKEELMKQIDDVKRQIAGPYKNAKHYANLQSMLEYLNSELRKLIYKK